MSILLKSIPIVFISFILAGCPLEGDDGATGATGTIDSVDLAATIATLPGVNCWDLNADGIKGIDEDRDLNGIVDVNDCHANENAIKQNPAALYDQNQMCKAMHSLNLGQTFMDNLGCHSEPISNQSGLVQRVFGDTFRNHAFNIEDTLKLEASDNGLAEYVVVGGYVARTIDRPTEDLGISREECESVCADDNECKVAFSNQITKKMTKCSIIYQSDTMAVRGENWTHICGLTIDSDDTSSCLFFLKNSNMWMRSTNTL